MAAAETSLPERVVRGLSWIVGILEEEGVPYQLTGGFAARLYGSARPINDIDIDVPEEFLPVVYGRVRGHCTFPLGRYLDERWDLEMMTIAYEGQEIDVCGCRDVRICDVRDGLWKTVSSHPSAAVMMDILGIRIPVMAADRLVAYKSMLQGEHQQEDIHAVVRGMGK